MFGPIVALFVACVSLLALAGPAGAQEKSATRPGFVLKPGSARILLFRPRILVGAQSTGAMFEPNADWTEQARENLGKALAAAQTTLGNTVVVAPEAIGKAAARLAAYQALFATVADAVVEYQFFAGNRLPTKKRAGQFDWTLGPGVADLAKDTGCDYALFIGTEDQYGSTGRKIFQFVAAVARVPIVSGSHKGQAGLVDLRTGDLVWLNADMRMGGDVRDPAGASKRMMQLLEDFPGRSLDTTASAESRVATR